MPVVIGGKGVERIVEIELNGAERGMFEKSAQAVKAWSRPARRLLPILANDAVIPGARSASDVPEASLLHLTVISRLATCRSPDDEERACMNIHEYQAKAVLREFGVPVPRGIAAFSVDEAVKAAKDLGGPVWVVKAQIHAGGRGKAGGVKVVQIGRRRRSARPSACSARRWSRIQTGPHGKEVHRLYIEEGSAIDREYYLSALVDRTTSRIAFVASTEGGMEIEEVAHNSPRRSSPSRSIRRPASCRIMRHAVAHALRLRPRGRQAGGERAAEALSGVPRQGHEPAGDQSARRHQGRAS